MFKQGNPDGPNDHYRVHIADRRTETVIRQNSLGNMDTKSLCGNGSWHKWFATNPREVTCEECRRIHEAK